MIISNWYPTLHLTYELGDFEEIQLNYSKRVNRADSDEHNPFAEYDDPQTREVGNPLPEARGNLFCRIRLSNSKG